VSFSARQSLDDFYLALGQPAPSFQQYVDNVFLPKLKKPMMKGGASRSQRKQTVQEAVDAMQMYATLNVRDAADKRYRFETSFRKVFGGNLPPNTPTASVQASQLKTLQAKFQVVEKKFMLLDYWQAVAKGDTEPEYPEDGAHWAMHEMLQFDPLKVRPILQLMVDDANHVLSNPRISTDVETWAGKEFTVSKQFSREGIAHVIKFEAKARAGVQVNGEMEMEYGGLKAKVNGEVFAGARGGVAANLTTGATGIEAGAKVECEVGIIVKGHLECDVFDILEIGADLNAMAGAMASAEVEFVANHNGVKVKLEAEAFAGVRVTGSAQGKLKIGGREIASTKVKASAWAGAGATAGANFECDIFGKVSFGAKAGAAAGVGGSVESAFGIDFHNVHWATANVFWNYVNEKGFKNQGKVYFIPVEENVAMCTRARDVLFALMGELYAQNEAQVAKLERWKVIERRMSAYQPRLTA